MLAAAINGHHRRSNLSTPIAGNTFPHHSSQSSPRPPLDHSHANPPLQMAEEKKHHFFHHHKEEKPAEFSDSSYPEGEGYNEGERHRKEEKEHKRKEHLGEVGTLAAGAFAMYEKHQAKKDPENAHRHKIEEGVAAAVAVGSGGYAFHEHHEKKDSKKEAEAAEGKRHHHF